MHELTDTYAIRFGTSYQDAEGNPCVTPLYKEFDIAVRAHTRRGMRRKMQRRLAALCSTFPGLDVKFASSTDPDPVRMSTDLGAVQHQAWDRAKGVRRMPSRITRGLGGRVCMTPGKPG